MSLYICSELIALALICALQTIAGDVSFTCVAEIGEDGATHCYSHKGSAESIQDPGIIILAIIGIVAALAGACALCRCLKNEVQGRVNTSTVHVVSRQPLQLNVYNLQQLAPQPASAPVVTCQKPPTVPPCPDVDLPPPYEVAVACGSYNLQGPNTSAYKQ